MIKILSYISHSPDIILRINFKVQKKKNINIHVKLMLNKATFLFYRNQNPKTTTWNIILYKMLLEIPENMAKMKNNK